MSTIESVKRLAHVLRYVTGVSILLFIFTYLFMWFYPATVKKQLDTMLAGINQPELPDKLLFTGLGLSLIPFAMLLYGFYNIWKLLALYASGDLFPVKGSLYLQRFGLTLCFLAPTQILIRSLASLVFSMNNPPGKRQLIIELGSNDVVMFLIGTLIYIVGKVSVEAARVAEENKQFL